MCQQSGWAQENKYVHPSLMLINKTRNGIINHENLCDCSCIKVEGKPSSPKIQTTLNCTFDHTSRGQTLCVQRDLKQTESLKKAKCGLGMLEKSMGTTFKAALLARTLPENCTNCSLHSKPWPKTKKKC